MAISEIATESNITKLCSNETPQQMSAFSDIFLPNRTPNNDNVDTLISDTYQI